MLSRLRTARCAAVARAAVAFLASSMLVGCQSRLAYLDEAPPLPANVDAGSWALLATGDVVRVTVAGHPEMSTVAEGQRVDQEGLLHLPLLGSLRVSGSTLDEARATIAEVAGVFVRAPSVSLSVLSLGARDFYIVGHVDAPGAFRIDRPLSVAQAVSLGGKFLTGANRENVFLLRPTPQGYGVHRFDSTRPSPDWLVPVQPDDVIFVPRGHAGAFSEEVMPYLDGLGRVASVPIAFAALD